MKTADFGEGCGSSSRRDDVLNVHDLLARSASDLSADVKQEPDSEYPEFDRLIDDPVDFKDVLEQEVESNGAASEAGTSEVAQFFCALCQQQVPLTVPKVVVKPDPAFKEMIRQKLLIRHCTWKVNFTLMGSKPKFLCQHHLTIARKSWKKTSVHRTLCTLCGNNQILMKYTTVIPSDPEGQTAWRERSAGAPFSSERLEKMFALARQQDELTGPLRLCNDHLETCDIPVDMETVEPLPPCGLEAPSVDPAKSVQVARAVDIDARLRDNYLQHLTLTNQREAQAARLLGAENWEKLKTGEAEKFEAWHVTLEANQKERSTMRKFVPKLQTYEYRTQSDLLSKIPRPRKKRKDSRELTNKPKQQRVPLTADQRRERDLMRKRERGREQREETKKRVEELRRWKEGAQEGLWMPNTETMGNANVEKRERQRIEERVKGEESEKM